VTQNIVDCDVAIIGAGPAGSSAAKMLKALGYSVSVIERDHFPRFSIGESLLPACMDLLEEADMLTDIQKAGFQYKKGATFRRCSNIYSIDFTNKFSNGWDHTYQVQRDRFDDILAQNAVRAGASIYFGCTITDMSLAKDNCIITYINSQNKPQRLRSRFCLDASGAGRVLARALDLSRPSDFPVRQAVFSHFSVPASNTRIEWEKITATIHFQHSDMWYWLIPFENGTCSVGAVGTRDVFNETAVSIGSEDPKDLLLTLIDQDPMMKDLLSGAVAKGTARQLIGYASDIKQLHGDGFAILGNAGEFLDPIFSSGVTIALKSASLAVAALHQQLQGKNVDWETEFSTPLQDGINVFRAYVDAWYDGTLPLVFFHPNPSPDIARMLCSILAGYVWDNKNPYVKHPKRRLSALVELCRTS